MNKKKHKNLLKFQSFSVIEKRKRFSSKERIVVQTSKTWIKCINCSQKVKNNFFGLHAVKIKLQFALFCLPEL